MLQKGDIVDVIAPSGRFETADISLMKAYLEAKGCVARIPEDILGDHPFSAQSDALRLQQLQAALLAPDSRFIWCVRGGYGTVPLMPSLFTLKRPAHSKYLLGFSDITALHLFCNQHWGWTTIHGPMLRQVSNQSIGAASLQAIEALLFQPKPQLKYDLLPLNNVPCPAVRAPLTGGNLTLINCSIGTLWHIETQSKILLLEDINELAYRVDRSLHHLEQAGVLAEIKALIFGDFTFENPAEKQRIEDTITRFAARQSLPVFRLPEMGHERENKPWLYAEAVLCDNVLSQSL